MPSSVYNSDYDVRVRCTLARRKTVYWDDWVISRMNHKSRLSDVLNLEQTRRSMIVVSHCLELGSYFESEFAVKLPPRLCVLQLIKLDLKLGFHLFEDLLLLFA